MLKDLLPETDDLRLLNSLMRERGQGQREGR